MVNGGRSGDDVSWVCVCVGGGGVVCRNAKVMSSPFAV